MSNNVYASCVAYAFEQCYSSQIPIVSEDITSDEELLCELKTLVAEYETALKVADWETLTHIIPLETLRAVKNAQTLEEVYYD